MASRSKQQAQRTPSFFRKHRLAVIVSLSLLAFVAALTGYILYANRDRPLPEPSASRITPAADAQAVYSFRPPAAMVASATLSAETDAPVQVISPLMAPMTCLSGIYSWDQNLKMGSAATIGLYERIHVVPDPPFTPNAIAYGARFPVVKGGYFPIVTDDGFYGYICSYDGPNVVLISPSQPVLDATHL